MIVLGPVIGVKFPVVGATVVSFSMMVINENVAKNGDITTIWREFIAGSVPIAAGDIHEWTQVELSRMTASAARGSL